MLSAELWGDSLAFFAEVIETLVESLGPMGAGAAETDEGLEEEAQSPSDERGLPRIRMEVQCPVFAVPSARGGEGTEEEEAEPSPSLQMAEDGEMSPEMGSQEPGWTGLRAGGLGYTAQSGAWQLVDPELGSGDLFGSETARRKGSGGRQVSWAPSVPDNK